MPGIKAGLMVSNQQFEGVDMVSALEDQYVMVRLARDRGWDSYFTGQHYLNEGNQGLQMVPYLARLAADEVMEEDEFVLRRAPLERLLQPVVLIFSQGPAPAVEGIRFGFGKPVRINYNKKRIAPVPGKIAFS